MAPGPDGLLLQRVRVRPDGPETALVVRDGRIAVPDGRPVADEVDLDGRWVLPGLWDHHVHLDQWALTRSRHDVSAATDPRAAVDLVRAVSGEEDLVVGYGYRSALWAEAPHRDLLDAVRTPTVLVGADLHSCWLNGAALERYGEPDHPTGVLREGAAFRVLEDLRRRDADRLEDLVADAVTAAARRGVVGIVDFESPWRLDAWSERIARGIDLLRVHAAVWPARLDEALGRGLRTGDPVGPSGLLTAGPLKIVSDGSLNTRTAYCDDPYPGTDGHGLLLVPPDELEALLRRASDGGMTAAVHAIGDHAAALALDAFAAAGVGGSVEHAQLLRPADVGRLAGLGLVASVQPEHALDDRDVADRLWAGRTGRAFPLADLLAAGATLRLGSDAPVAPLDPWVSLSAAVRRTRDDRPEWHPEQQIPVAAAIAASTGTGRAELRPGDPADLVVVDADPYDVDALRTMPVAGTMVGGRWTVPVG